MTDTFKKQLKSVISAYESARFLLKYTEDPDDISDFSYTQITELHTRCVAAIERAAGKDSTYFERFMKMSMEAPIEYYQVDLHQQVDIQIGVAKALLFDIENDYLTSFEETIHGDLFADYVEMAAHLVENGYKDPAAVLAGSTLEVHLRQLCKKHDVAAEPDGKMKKTQTLNQDLAQAGAYTKLDLKSITAWLDIRNNTAHGKYDKYDESQVKNLISFVRGFIEKYPA